MAVQKALSSVVFWNAFIEALLHQLSFGQISAMQRLPVSLQLCAQARRDLLDTPGLKLPVVLLLQVLSPQLGGSLMFELVSCRRNGRLLVLAAEAKHATLELWQVGDNLAELLVGVVVELRGVLDAGNIAFFSPRLVTPIRNLFKRTVYRVSVYSFYNLDLI